MSMWMIAPVPRDRMLWQPFTPSNATTFFMTS